MKDFRKKVNLIYIPYLLAQVICIIGYSIFDWFVYLRGNNPDAQDYWFFLLGPFIMAIVVVLIWLRPRFNLIVQPPGMSDWILQLRLNMLAILSIFLMVFPLQYILSQFQHMPEDYDNGPLLKLIIIFLVMNAAFLFIICQYNWDKKRLKAFEDKRCVW